MLVFLFCAETCLLHFQWIKCHSTSLYINCGGGSLKIGNNEYQSDLEAGGASYFYAVDSRWGFSNTGNFLDDGLRDSYIAQESCGISMNASYLYNSARVSALSLTYYAFCLLRGSYNVRLHFAEIIFTNDGTYSSLGRRVFDIYIQVSSRFSWINILSISRLIEFLGGGDEA
ncbi:hypothetical protein L1987_19221 [Smallanthus sonchifolius]|uniref:Uncharacterized protein n=1 Tax=Smallanthus sonchifolius TaxID=185202 RepID=A0ACB9INQ1_9ASTR|nr:hypothetical protein L1987_19221 [Smallanthus sonchifolius]